ncbi:formate dehydrogenase accessory sulfurtransferase FdhD [Massilia niabensis]|uniref:Sulfur carrier protein FdhD n=1 Tax=Massilia niabensis TaxID=544910 RepID=A0ABW0L5E0_9BURK
MNAAEAFLGAAPEATQRLAASRWEAGRMCEGSELVAEEVPVALAYNGITHAVMLASPLDLEDFALGFTLSERIVRQRRDVYDIEVEETARGIVVSLRIAAGAMARMKGARAARTGKTGCGLCGVESLEYFEREACLPEAPPAPAARFDPAALHRAMAAMAARQQLHHATGAVHAAAWADPEGRLDCVREDVGRHNALDKLVGSLARAGAEPPPGFAVVTSRASFEMVQKAARAGFGMLAAISAPTALAVRMAEEAGLTLAGFVRGGRHVVYSHPERMLA